MALGIPVLGYAWGGTKDLISHKENGYLVEPGDIAGLVEGYNYLRDHWKAISARAIESSKLYDWRVVMESYAALYTDLAISPAPANKTSIVITSYNYAPFVRSAVESALSQTRPSEIIVVNDGSTDSTDKVLAEYAGRVKVLTQPNQGVAAARNNGIRAASGDYIICLDADDWLDPRYVEACANELDQDRGLGIAYTGLTLYREGASEVLNPWPPDFSWEIMAKPGNPPSSCIPSAAMFRKAVWERAGGYRQQYAPAEDTEFWVRGLSLGWTARKITDDGLFHYRLHSQSASRTKTYKPIDTWLPWMRDQKYPLAAPSSLPAQIRSYSRPAISVIIPVGPGHAPYLPNALESLIGQSFREWEVIVVNDSGAPLDLGRYPFVHLLTSTRRSPAIARNQALLLASAPLTLFLDADDWLHPFALEHMLWAYMKAGGRYIYTDWKDSKGTIHSSAEYDRKRMLDFLFHPITVLMDTAKVRKLGFEALEALEDWDFFIRAAIEGFEGFRLAEPLLNVRLHSNRITEKSQPLVGKIKTMYAQYREGNTLMSRSCCGGYAGPILDAKVVLGMLAPEPPIDPLPTKVRMVFTGEQRGAISFGGSGATPTGKLYRGGNNAFEKYIDADPEDVSWLERTGMWVRQPPPAESIISELKALPEVAEPLPVEIEPEVLLLEDETKDAPPPAPEVVVSEPSHVPPSPSPKRRGRPPKSVRQVAGSVDKT